MYRPKKKKSDDPLLPEKDGADERNLVEAEESADLSFEDRINMYWMENRGFIIGCIIVLVLLVVGYQGVRLYMQHAEQRLREDYREARSGGTLPAFAESHPDAALGGFAALQVADDAYSAGDYARALEFYRLAETALAGHILSGRARIGHAFALFHSGKESEGLARLRAIAADGELPEPVRSEAAYHLAVHADVEGRDDAFESYAAQIRGGDSQGPWQRRLDFYLRQAR